MKKMWFLLVLTLSLVNFAHASESAANLTENQCLSFGMTASNISNLVAQGATAKDILATLDNPGFKTNPEDIQRLVVVTIQYLTSTGMGQTPEQNFRGASNFCLRLDGDVEMMIKTIQEVLGTMV